MYDKSLEDGRRMGKLELKLSDLISRIEAIPIGEPIAVDIRINLDSDLRSTFGAYRALAEEYGMIDQKEFRDYRTSYYAALTLLYQNI